MDACSCTGRAASTADLVGTVRLSFFFSPLFCQRSPSDSPRLLDKKLVWPFLPQFGFRQAINHLCRSFAGSFSHHRFLGVRSGFDFNQLFLDRIFSSPFSLSLKFRHIAIDGPRSSAFAKKRQFSSSYGSSTVTPPSSSPSCPCSNKCLNRCCSLISLTSLANHLVLLDLGIWISPRSPQSESTDKFQGFRRWPCVPLPPPCFPQKTRPSSFRSGNFFRLRSRGLQSRFVFFKALFFPF